MPSARLSLPCFVALFLVIVSLAFPPVAVHGQSSTASYVQYSAFVPVGVDVDAAGNVYVADSECYCVIKLSSAGREVGRYNISDRYLRGVPPYVTDVAVDQAGNMYVSGQRGYPTVPIVKLSPKGALLAQLTINSQRLFDVRYIAVDSAGALYAVDTYSDTVYKFDSNSTQPTANYSAPDQLAPLAVAVDAAGFVYVIDEYRFVVMKFAVNGTLVQTIQGAARYVPVAVAVDSAGNILVMAVDIRIRRDVRIVTFSPAGVHLFNFSLGLQQLINPAAYPGPHFRVDSADNLYLPTGWAVYKLNSTDGSQLAAYNNSAPPFVSPSVLAIDAAGYMYVANFASDSSFAGLKLSPGGVVVQTFAWNVTFRFTPIAWHTQGSDMSLYVLDIAANAVVQLSLTDKVLANISTLPQGLSQIVDVAADPSDGTLLVCDYFRDRVLKFALNNSMLAVYNNIPYPHGVAVDAAHNVYIVWSTLARVEKRSADGRSLFNFTTSSPRLSQPSGVALDAAGNVYINDFQNGRVVKLSPAGQQLAAYTTNSSAPYMTSNQMAVDPQGAHVLAWNRLTLIKFTTNSTQAATTTLLRSQEVALSVS